MNKLIVSDGGRDRDEKLDCVVRALAIALDIPYYQAHAIAAHAGRQPKHRMHYTKEMLSLSGLKIVPSYMSLTRFLKEHPTGIYFVHKRGHAFAVKNGVIYDTAPIGGQSIVTYYAEVSSGKPSEVK